MPETPFELPGTGLRLSHPVRSLDRLLLKGGGNCGSMSTTTMTS
jgi:hypothetical protein